MNTLALWPQSKASFMLAFNLAWPRAAFNQIKHNTRACHKLDRMPPAYRHLLLDWLDRLTTCLVAWARRRQTNTPVTN